MRAACLRLSGTLVSKTPTFIGSGRDDGVQRSLEYIPGSFIRGAFGVAMIKAFCVKPERVNNHDGCEARDGCPYFQLFSHDHKASNIIFRYAYPEHVGCPEEGVYFPLLNDFCVFKQNGSDAGSHRTYICSGCGHVTSNPINLMRVNANGLVCGGEHVVEVIPPETPFRSDVILALKVESYVDFVVKVLADALLRGGVGRWKSVGFGRLATTMRVEEISIDDIERRAGEIDGSKFSVRLLSPMVIDGAGFLTPPVLLEAARRSYSRVFHKGKPSLPNVRLVYKNFLFERHSGWSLKAGRGRRVKTAVSAGSVFAFESVGHECNLVSALAALEYYSVGAYKPHGCGQVVIEHVHPKSKFVSFSGGMRKERSSLMVCS